MIDLWEAMQVEPIVKIFHDTLRAKRSDHLFINNVRHLKRTLKTWKRGKKKDRRILRILYESMFAYPPYPSHEILLTKDCQAVNGLQICIRKIRSTLCGLFVRFTRNYEAR